MASYRFYTFALTVLLTLISCSDKKVNDEIMTRPTESNDQVTIPKENIKLDADAKRTRVVIHFMQGYGEDEGFAKEAAQLLEEIVNSPEFKSAVIANSYEHNKDLSPTQIYDKIMTAHEEDGPSGEDYVIDLRLRTINLEQDGSKWMSRCDPNSSAGTIGIDGGGTGIAAVCPQWLRSTAKAGRKEWLAAHFMHEYLHILNFKHPNKKPRSVPYKIHAIVEKLGGKFNPAA